MNKRVNKALKLCVHTCKGGRKGFKGYGKRAAAKANRNAGKALCAE